MISRLLRLENDPVHWDSYISHQKGSIVYDDSYLSHQSVSEDYLGTLAKSHIRSWGHGYLWPTGTHPSSCSSPRVCSVRLSSAHRMGVGVPASDHIPVASVTSHCKSQKVTKQLPVECFSFPSWRYINVYKKLYLKLPREGNGGNSTGLHTKPKWFSNSTEAVSDSSFYPPYTNAELSLRVSVTGVRFPSEVLSPTPNRSTCQPFPQERLEVSCRSGIPVTSHRSHRRIHIRVFVVHWYFRVTPVLKENMMTGNNCPAVEATPWTGRHRAEPRASPLLNRYSPPPAGCPDSRHHKIANLWLRPLPILLS